LSKKYHKETMRCITTIYTTAEWRCRYEDDFPWRPTTIHTSCCTHDDNCVLNINFNWHLLFDTRKAFYNKIIYLFFFFYYYCCYYRYYIIIIVIPVRSMEQFPFYIFYHWRMIWKRRLRLHTWCTTTTIVFIF